MRTTVDLDDELLRQVQQFSAGHGASVDEIVEEALRRYLLSNQRGETPFQLHTVKGELVQPNRTLDRTAQFFVEDDEARYAKRMG